MAILSERDRNEQYGSNNRDFQTEGVMKLRIDSQAILKEIECFLRGGVYVPTKRDGIGVEVFERRGDPKMNDKGVQSLMSLLRPWFSPMTVQGNFTSELYTDFILELDLALSKVVVINMPSWEVKVEDYNCICDMIIMTAIAFFTRLINDGERASYAHTVKVSESSQVQQNGGMFGLGLTR